MANPDRTLILDLSAVEEARGPRPNDFFVCVTPREAATCAYAIGALLKDGGCPERECTNCNRHRRLFWSLANELGPRLQGELFAALLSSGYQVPDGAWEEVG